MSSYSDYSPHFQIKAMTDEKNLYMDEPKNKVSVSKNLKGNGNVSEWAE